MKLGREVGLRQFSHQTFMMADLQDLGLYPECRGNLLKCSGEYQWFQKDNSGFSVHITLKVLGFG